MKISTVLLTTVASVMACPGMDRAMQQVNERLSERAIGERADSNDSDELIGDLATTGATTTVGKAVQDIIVGSGNPESKETFSLLSSTLCLLPGADVCCIWKTIAVEMEAKFRGSSGRCNGFARGAIRLGFHDAGTWSKTTGYGGADGSIILAGEMTRGENNGLQEIVAVTQGWYNKYKSYGASMADIIQMGATVATVVCPLGPRVRSFIGRKDSTKPNADGLLPDVFASADSLIKLFEDKTIKAHGLTALLGAHTTSQQRFVDPSRATDPQDSSPGVWDVLFYGQTIGTVPTPPRVFKFPSDVALAAHPKIVDEWKEFAGPGGQSHWNEDYAREYVRLSLLGVNNINQLKECSKVLPVAVGSFRNSDQKAIDKWLNDLSLPLDLVKKVGQTLRDGSLLDSLLSLLGLKRLIF
ncbi:ligninase h2 precursor (peroxidase) [Phlyctema vagabunda]|uniref:Peroxidase n=1 Tax=Phlyctema vagabunda TaxID=108571 RepID=A0ABR4PU26_9HELO